MVSSFLERNEQGVDLTTPPHGPDRPTFLSQSAPLVLHGTQSPEAPGSTGNTEHGRQAATPTPSMPVTQVALLHLDKASLLRLSANYQPRQIFPFVQGQASPQTTGWRALAQFRLPQMEGLGQ